MSGDGAPTVAPPFPPKYCASSLLLHVTSVSAQVDRGWASAQI
jgi:hypothetical protein